MKKLIPAILTILLLTVGCKEQQQEFLSFTVDVSTDSSVLLSEIADQVDMIQLETNDDTFLNDIRQVELFDDYLLVKDVQPELFVFDRQGNFIRKIGKSGQGPGEYNNCTRFTLDYLNKRILLKTNVGIMVYDIQGNFLEKYPPSVITDLFYNDNKFYSLEDIFYNEKDTYHQDTYFSIYNANYNRMDSMRLRSYESGVMRVTFATGSRRIFLNNGDIYVHSPDLGLNNSTSDTLYILSDNRLKTYASIKLTHTQDESIHYIYPSGRYMITTNNRLTDVPGSSIKQHHISHCIYDQKTREMRYAKDGVIDDIYDSGRRTICPLHLQGSFYAVKEGELSEEMNTELNPTIYIGTFKK